MSFYIGPVYIRDGDLFLLFAAGLLVVSAYFQIPLPYIDAQSLLFITILFFLGRGLVAAANEVTLYILFLTSLLVAVSQPLSTVFLYILISFVVLKVAKQL